MIINGIKDQKRKTYNSMSTESVKWINAYGKRGRWLVVETLEQHQNDHGEHGKKDMRVPKGSKPTDMSKLV